MTLGLDTTSLGRGANKSPRYRVALLAGATVCVLALVVRLMPLDSLAVGGGVRASGLAPRGLTLAADAVAENGLLIIGDVHGCIEELDEMLRHRKPGQLVVFVGDVLLKGPDSEAVVQRLKGVGALGVLGNNDASVLSFLEGEDSPNPAVLATAATLSPDSVLFLRSLPHFIRVPSLNTIIVHAGVCPGSSPETSIPEDLMNLRSVLPDGTCVRTVTGEPWAGAWKGPETIIFGHDAIRGLQRTPHAIGLDAGCVYGHQLVGLHWPADELVHVAAKAVYAGEK